MDTTKSPTQKQASGYSSPDWTAEQCLSFLESIGELLSTWRRHPGDSLHITAGALGNLGLAIGENAQCLRRCFEESVFYGKSGKGGQS